jgi:CheY-like chemotaxis protein
VNEPPLLRPSALARYWAKHPATVLEWIRQGRLPAVRSPGNRFMVRPEDARAFCEREDLPVPPFVEPQVPRVVVAGMPAAARRALARALKAGGVSVEAMDGYDAIVAAAARKVDALVLGASTPRLDVGRAIAALRRAPQANACAIVVVGAPNASRAAALERAGATRVIVRARPEDLTHAVQTLLSLNPKSD